MIISTSTHIEGKPATVQLGLVAAEVIFGANIIKDFIAGGADWVGGRNRVYERVFADARIAALKEIEEQAAARGANAILAVRVDYQVLGANNGMLMATASGTAVGIPFTAAEQRQMADEEAIHYLDLAGQRRGPFSLAQLRELLDQGRVTGADVIHDEAGVPAGPIAEILAGK